MGLFREIHIHREHEVPLKRQERPWEKHTPQGVGHLRRQEAPEYGVVSFYWLGNCSFLSFFFINFVYLFIFGRVGSSLLFTGFL